MEKTIIFAQDFWYDDGMLVCAGEYPFIEGDEKHFPMFFADGEWMDLCDLDALEYEVF